MIVDRDPQYHMPLLVGAFVAIIIGRAANIYPLSFLLNLGRNKKIPWKSQHMMFLSGLRGAIAFGLSINNSATEGRRTLRTITHIIILVTVVISGGSTVNTLRWLKIPTGKYNNYSVYTIEYKTEIFQHKFPMTMHLIL